MVLSRRLYFASIAIIGLSVVGGTWGYLAYPPALQTPPVLAGAIIGPLAILMAVIASGGSRRSLLILVVGLIDVESAMLGIGPIITFRS